METENINEKIPPLFIMNVTDFVKFREEISLILHNNFSAINKNNKIKINLEIINDFRTLIKFLEGKNMNISRKDLKGRKTSQPSHEAYHYQSLNPKYTKKKNLNYPIKSVTKLVNKNKLPMPLVAIQLANTEKSNEIFKHKKLINYIITIEPRGKFKDPPQCTNCQRYGHIHKSCKLNPRCVKCDGNHYYSNCPKDLATPLQCVNCNEPHPANYKGCTYYKKTINTKSITITKQNAEGNILPIPNVTKNVVKVPNKKITCNNMMCNITCNNQRNIK